MFARWQEQEEMCSPPKPAFPLAICLQQEGCGCQCVWCTKWRWLQDANKVSPTRLLSVSSVFLDTVTYLTSCVIISSVCPHLFSVCSAMWHVEQQKHEVKRGRCEGEGGEGKGVKRRWNGSNPVKRKSKRKQRKEKEGLESKWITDENEIWKKCIVS